jgi:hypothetical protein
VEIKSSVFKRFEKENTFQLTCADIVERFQLWIMLIIIGMRNVVEVGGLSVPRAGTDVNSDPGSPPLHTASILPASFTILPPWLWSGEVLSPFLIVIGIEMIVDWIKHAYINKFNNIKPNLYSRILDILCKDYYTNVSRAIQPRYLPRQETKIHLVLRHPISHTTIRLTAASAILSLHSRLRSDLPHVRRHPSAGALSPVSSHLLLCGNRHAFIPRHDCGAEPSR